MQFIFIFLLLFLFPAEAWAWGPGVHLAIGDHVLTHLQGFAPVVASALTLHPQRFLYGCLSADILIGKGCRFTPTHSHNWSTGRTLLRQAESSEEAAYAYGYLSHLAADVIAHNYLVPNMLAFSAGHGKFSHTYVEMQADLRVEWPEASRLFRLPHKAEDKLLRLAVAQKKMPFLMKKHLFRQSVWLVEKKSYRRSLGIFRHANPSTWNIWKDEFILKSIDLAQNLVMNLLSDPLRSPALECDPIGSANLDQIRSFRKRQRDYYLRHGQGIIFPLDPRLETFLLPQGDNHELISRFSA